MAGHSHNYLLAEDYEERYGHLEEPFLRRAFEENVEYRASRSLRSRLLAMPFLSRVVVSNRTELHATAEGLERSRDQMLGIIQAIGEEAVAAKTQPPAFITQIPRSSLSLRDFA